MTSASAQATYNWTGAGADNNWSTALNWSGGVPPNPYVAGASPPATSAGTANLVFGASSRLNPIINTPWNINSLTFSSGAGAYTIGGSQLFLEASGITNNSTATQTITASLRLGVVSTTMNLTTVAGGTTILSGDIDWYGVDFIIDGAGNTILSGTGTDTGPTARLTKNGTGTLTITGSNAYTGRTYGTLINAGIVNVQNANALGNPGGGLGTTVVSGAELQIQGGITMASQPLTLAGTGASGNGALRSISGNNTWTGAIALSAASSIGADSDIFTLSGVISGANALTKLGAGTLTLAGTNTFTGATTLNAGVLSVGTIGNGGSSGNLGAASNAAANLVFDGGTLQYTGATASTNRSFTINAGKTATFDITTNNLTVSGASTATNGALTKLGAGTLTLSGNNAYTGATTLSAGVLSVGTIGNGGSSGNLGAASNAAANLVFDGGNLQYTGATASTNRSFTINAGKTATFDITTNNLTVSGASTATNGALAKAGAGTLTLSGNNAYTGATTLSAGVLSVGTIGNGGSSGNLGAASNAAANLFFDGGTLQYTGATASTDRGFTVNAGKTATFDITTNNLTVSGASAATSGGLTKIGAGTLSLSGSNSHTGATILGAGVLSVGTIGNGGSSGNLGAASNAAANLVFDGGTLQYTGATASSDRNFTINAGKTATIDITTNNLTVSGASSATNGALTKLGAGTLTLSGTNAHTGATKISAGVLSVATIGNGGSSGNLGAASNAAANLVFDGGTLQYTGATASTNRSFTINAGKTATFDITTNNLTVSGASTATNGALTKLGVGTLTLTGTNTHTGATTLSAGVLSVGTIGNGGSSGNLGAASNAAANLVFDGGTLQYTGATASTNRNFTINAGDVASFDITTNNLTVSGASTATNGALAKLGAGTLTLSGNNAYTGATTLSAGVLSVATIGNGGVSGNLGAASNAAANLVFDGGTLQYTGATASTNRGFTINAGKTATFNITTNNLTVSGASAATNGAMTKLGAGTLTLSGNNAYTGATTLSAGVLSVATIGNGGVSGNLGAASNAAANLVFDGGTLQYTGATASADRRFTINAGKTATFDVTTNNLTISGASAATNGALTKIGAGTLTLAGANLHSGITTVTAGVLGLGNLDALLNSTLDTGSSGTQSVTFTVAGTNTYNLGGLQGSDPLANSGNTLSVGSNGTTTTYSGVFSGSGGLIKVGAGTLNMSGANSHSGVTKVNSGVLAVGNLNALQNSTLDTGTSGSQAITFTVAGTNTYNIGGLQGDDALANNGNTLSIGANGANTTYSGVLSGTGALAKLGAGTLTLSGLNVYNASTSVTAGTLQVGVGTIGSTGTGVMTVGNGSSAATLAGSGTIGGTANVTNHVIRGLAFLKPGDNSGLSNGGLTFNGNLNLNNNSQSQLQITAATASAGSFGGNSIGSAGYLAFVAANVATWNSAAPGNHDWLKANGTLTLGTNASGLIVVQDNGYLANAKSGDVIDVLDWSAISVGSFKSGTNYRSGGLGGGDLSLPDLASKGLVWDISQFTSSGILLVVPEPSRAILLIAGLGAVLLRRRRCERWAA